MPSGSEIKVSIAEAIDRDAALMNVAEAAAVLFRPPYRWGAGVRSEQEAADFDRLYQALTAENCPVEIGEMLT